MGTFDIVDGDLITMALDKQFGVVAHGVNCFNDQKSGLSALMSKTFNTDQFPMEAKQYFGEANKMGCIDVKTVTDFGEAMKVVNCYIQWRPGAPSFYGIPLDYDALTMCMRKLGMRFPEGYIGMPRIGTGSGKGDWDRIKNIIKRELRDCYVTVVQPPKI